MRFREVDALIREAESREALATALKGGKAAKEFREERLALEKAAGGAKKLAEADKVRAETLVARTTETAAAKADALRITSAATDEYNEGKAVLVNEHEKLKDWAKKLAETQKVLDEQATKLVAAVEIVTERETGVDGASMAVGRREGAVEAREKKVELREAAVKRREDYFAAAPA